MNAPDILLSYDSPSKYGEFAPLGTVYPYAQLHTAAPASNSFQRLPEAVAETGQGIGPGTGWPNVMRGAFKKDLAIKAGCENTGIAIGSLMREDNAGTGQQEYWLYFTRG